MYPIVFLECPMHAMNKNLKKAVIYVQLYTIIYSICTYSVGGLYNQGWVVEYVLQVQYMQNSTNKLINPIPCFILFLVTFLSCAVKFTLLFHTLYIKKYKLGQAKNDFSIIYFWKQERIRTFWKLEHFMYRSATLCTLQIHLDC